MLAAWFYLNIEACGVCVFICFLLWKSYNFELFQNLCIATEVAAKEKSF